LVGGGRCGSVFLRPAERKEKESGFRAHGRSTEDQTTRELRLSWRKIMQRQAGFFFSRLPSPFDLRSHVTNPTRRPIHWADGLCNSALVSRRGKLSLRCLARGLETATPARHGRPCGEQRCGRVTRNSWHTVAGRSI